MPAWGLEIVQDTATSLMQKVAGQIEAAQVALELGATADYAPFVELGTRFMRAQPFIRPAFDANVEKFKHAILMGALNGNAIAQAEAVGVDMIGLAREIVPVRTGFLRSTIYYRLSQF